jgi:hypothetical protein
MADRSDFDPSGLDPTIEVMTKGYDLLTEQIKSLQNRCGVGLGIMVAASPSGVFRFLRIMPDFLERGWRWAYIIGAVGIILFALATFFFLRGFFVDKLYLPYDKEDLTHIWQEGEEEVKRYRLSSLSSALDGLDSAATEKRNQLMKGIVFVIFGVLVFLAIEILRYIVGLSEGGQS